MEVELLSYIEVISNTGFPIVISMYLLNRMEKKLDTLVQAIEKLGRI
ncbi:MULTISPECIES: YvrJ family protein [unclassified Jeotgalibaca]